MKTYSFSAASCLILAAILALALYGCAVTPKNTTETVYAAGWTLVGATNSVADLHDAGTLKGADYDKAKAVLAQATTAYASARAALTAGKPADAQTYLVLAQTLLNQLAAYLSAHGG